MTSFTGIWVPLVTPFRGNAVDYAALQALASRLVEAGVSGLVVCGSTGEAAALGEGEQLEALDAVLDTVPQCPVVMGLAGNNMAHVLARMQQIQRRSIAGLLAPPPYYIRPSQAGLVDYFRALADASSAPVILYNIPYRTGVAIEPSTFRTIAQHERIVAVKDCGGDQSLTMRLIGDSQLQVLAGEDHLLLSTLCLGGSGAITASAHIRPDLFVRIAQLVRNEALSEAREIFYRLLPLIRLLFREPNPGPLKAALSMMGDMQDMLRAPMHSVSAETKEQLARELRRLECL
ncbi:4-hydroxy-tetrahydrodipicolinate synthase [Noviherbaspirillum sp.]|jgi:4-hydroxy-tetrahydrodipicolinate synthase|uniref:4-hydroxy-tetrahydrodipicolinate synthase n=1 Tax=Noviherbaspirillum sp. TaxID=1926288 RepID=UPI0025EA915A|nr:4-hydroxy-tetrahydrodipicolinate synthase [Noviherbaspirillum sp.]